MWWSTHYISSIIEIIRPIKRKKVMKISMNFSPLRNNMLKIAKNTKLMLIFFRFGAPNPTRRVWFGLWEKLGSFSENPKWGAPPSSASIVIENYIVMSNLRKMSQNGKSWFIELVHNIRVFEHQTVTIARCYIFDFWEPSLEWMTKGGGRFGCLEQIWERP